MNDTVDLPVCNMQLLLKADRSIALLVGWRP